MKRLVFMFVLLTTTALGQTTPCVVINSGTTITTGTGLNCTPTGAPPPPAGNLAIVTTQCPPWWVGLLYNCWLVASGGTEPYTWSLTSGTLPTGLSLIPATESISGTPAASASVNLTMTVTDSSTPTPLSVSGPVTLSIASPISSSTCGWPTYNCARTDYITIGYSAGETMVSSNGTTPYNNGCQTSQVVYSGQVNYNPCSTPHPCTAGMTEVSTNPTLPASNGSPTPNHASNLQNCGNVYGLNTVVVDPRYNNVQMLRVTDAGDFGTYNCGEPEAYPGGFDSSSNYVVIAGCGVKWLDPIAFRINTSVNSQGWVVIPGGTKWTPAGTMIAGTGASPGAFFNAPNAVMTKFHVTNGVLDSTTGTNVADLSYAIPCWGNSTYTSTNRPGICSDWAPNTTYHTGMIIVPLTNNDTQCVSNQAFCHHFESFQVADADCVSGPTEPQWVIPLTNGANQKPGFPITSVSLTSNIATYTYTPFTGWPSIVVGQLVSVKGVTNTVFNVTQAVVTAVTGTTFSVALTNANVAATAQTTAYTTVPDSSGVANIPAWAQGATVLYDGTCRWMDTYLPIAAGGGATANNKFYHAGVGARNENIYAITLGNNAGQDGAGTCHVTNYIASLGQFAYLNTCTGNVYSTLCVGSVNFDCSGGTWTLNWLGNAFEDNTFFPSNPSTGPAQRISRYVMHGSLTSLDGRWVHMAANQCALADTNGPVECWEQCTDTNFPNICISSQAITGGSYIWEVGSKNFLDDKTALVQPSPGHSTAGFSQQYFDNGSVPAPIGAARINLPWNVNRGASNFPNTSTPINYWNISQGPCTGLNTNCIAQQCPSPAVGQPVPSTTSFNTVDYCPGGVAPSSGFGVSDCVPHPCWSVHALNGNNVLTIGRSISWDQHMNWSGNSGTDTSPLCENTYLGTNVYTNAFMQNIFGSIQWIWPPQWPWADELVCFASDGSNKVWRQANQWNSGSEINFGPEYGYSAGNSQDGQFYILTSDQWCTIGGGIWSQWTTGTSMTNGGNGATNTPTVLCGLPFQSNHPYAVGEYVAPVQTTPTLRCESMVFKVVVAGTSGKMAGTSTTDSSGICGNFTTVSGTTIPTAVPYWNCAGASTNGDLGTPGCYVKQTDGTAVFQYIGRSNALAGVFIVKLQ